MCGASRGLPPSPLEKLAVERLNGPAAVGVIHHEGDVNLRGAMGYHQDIYLRVLQRLEHIARDPRRGADPLADQADDALILLDRYVSEPLKLLDGQLEVTVGVERHRDRHLAGGDHVDRDPVATEDLEDAGQEAVTLEHPRRRDRDDQVIQVVGDRFDRWPALLDPGDDHRAGVVGLERVEAPHRDTLTDRRPDGGRMEHLPAVVRELAGLVERECLERFRAGGEARIGGHDAIHVAPDLDLLGVDRGAEGRGGVVRAVPAQRRDAPALRLADVASHDRELRQLQDVLLDLGVGLGQGLRAAEVVRREKAQVERVVLLGRDTELREVGRDDAGREPFAERDDVVQRPGTELLDQRDALEQDIKLVQLPLEQVEVKPHLLQAVPVAFADGVDGGGDTPDRLLAQLEEVVRHAAERAGNHQRFPRKPALDDLEDLTDLFRVGDRATAEFHNYHIFAPTLVDEDLLFFLKSTAFGAWEK